MTWNLASGLENKRVIVTGGAGGIGREVALAFAAAGARVAVVDLSAEKVKAVVDELAGGRICLWRSTFGPSPIMPACSMR